MVHAHLPANPHVGQITLAQPSHMPSTANPFNDGPHPQRHQNLRINGIPPDAPFDRLNLPIQRLQIERVDIGPHRPHPMILRNQLIQRRIPPLHLIPLRPLDPNSNHGNVIW